MKYKIRRQYDNGHELVGFRRMLTYTFNPPTRNRVVTSDVGVTLSLRGSGLSL